MRTVIARLHPEVEAQLAALEPRLQDVARRYIRRLALQPHLGYRLQRGRLAEEQCRAVRFDRGDDPDDVLGGRRQAKRAGDEDPSRGPRWRIVYWPAETRDRELRVIVVLAVALAHPEPGHPSAFELAAGVLKAMRKERR